MAINTYRFWMATDANRLLANQNSFIQATPPAFYQGNVANLELYMVASAGVGLTPVEVPFPAGAEISVAVGNTNSYPTGGSWELSVDGVETEAMPYNATTTQVASALNALASVSAAGGVSVSKTGEGYTITWNTYGLKPSIGIGSDTLTPSSYESISLVQTGSAEHRQIVFVELRQNPIALSTDWTPLPNPAISSSLVKAWDGSSVIWRVTIYPQPKAGTMTLSYGNKSATLSVTSSATDISTALEAQVFATGRFQWDIVLSEDSTLDATGNLIGYNGYYGTINFATAECHQFLAGDEARSTTIEVSISVNDQRFTLIQTGCEIFADVISDGVLTPLPLGVALSEQVANARFVRRDIDQNPDAATQDIIWQNLGVETLGSDVAGAINGADSPSAANPFATISDIPTVTSAVWGQITGDITNQSDLDFALGSLDALKYDKSNPAGYIDGSALVGYATESWVQSQGYLTQQFNGGNVYNPINVRSLDTDTWGLNLSPGSIGISTEPGFYGQSTAGISPSGVSGYQAIYPSFPQFTLGGDVGLIITKNGNTTAVNDGVLTYNGVQPYATTSSVTSQINALANDVNLYYVPKIGAVFSTKATFTSVGGQAGLNVGIGGTSTSALTNGDLWITTGGTNLNFRDGTGAWRILVNTSNTNSFSAPQIIDTTSSTPALRITQKGIVAGQSRAIVVEDETSPDQNCFIIDQSGNVGVGVSNDPVTPWVAGSSKVEVVGNIKSTTLSTGAGPAFSVNSTASHTGGTDTLDLIVTIGGVNYRIGLRPA